MPEQCLPQQCQSCEASTWPYQTDQLDGRLHVGDAVLVLSASDRETREYVGATGQLVEDDQSRRPFRVEFDDGQDWWFRESELERVTTITPPHDSNRCSMCQRLGYDCSTVR